MTEDIYDLAEAVSAEYDADVYLYSGGINDSGFGSLVEEVSEGKKRDNCLLILTTSGGLANSAYQIARLIQKTYNEFILFVPCYCKSAGTLVALGANKLLMDSFSELGPLDVQLLQANEIGSRKSGLLTRSAFEALAEASLELFETYMLNITMRSGGLVSFRLASDISASLTSQLMAPIYSQINPNVVGSDYRDLNVAVDYGERLSQHGGNAKTGTIQKLVRGYPSHDFIIDDEEARSLFRSVDTPSEKIYEVVRKLASVTYKEARTPLVMRLQRPHPQDEREGDDGDEEVHGEGSPRPGGPEPVDDCGPPDRPSDPVEERRDVEGDPAPSPHGGEGEAAG